MENVNDKIIIYQSADGNTQIDVRLENETVWLTQAQMALLFEKTPQNITMHIRNAYSEGELDEHATCKEFLQVRREGVREIKRMQKFYDLDVIISVGYRVKSQRGTAFRIWARNVLKDYLVKGYAVNERIHKEQIGELRQLVGMLGRTIQNQPLLSTDETNALFNVVTDYTYALDTLDSYDYQRLTVSDTVQELYRADIPDIRRRGAVSQHRGEGRHAAVPCHQEPLLQRREQTHCRHPVPVVSE